jgi:hypothetical protein
MYMKIPMRIFKHSYLLYLLVSFLIWTQLHRLVQLRKMFLCTSTLLT